MTRRSKARQVVLQMLFQCDLNADVGPRAVRTMISELLEDPALREFAWGLYSGTTENRRAIDERIQSVAENWSLDRMAPTDRNVLRLGVFEIHYAETPPRVAIDEAIGLARRFGSDSSPQFVNGLLDRLMPGAETAQRSKPPAADHLQTSTDTVPGDSPEGPASRDVPTASETDVENSGRPDPRRRMAGHRLPMTPAVPAVGPRAQLPAETPQPAAADDSPQAAAPAPADETADSTQPAPAQGDEPSGSVPVPPAETADHTPSGNLPSGVTPPGA